jgi:group I intron endonuclease
MKVGIYKITSPSGKVYIGQSWDIERRWRDHKKSKWEKSRKLYSSFTSHGFEKHLFEIIHELPNDVTQDVLDNYEALYMACYRFCGIELLNIREAGSNGKLSDETKELLRKCSTNKFKKGHTFNIGRVHSDKTKKIKSEISKKIQRNQEYKTKMSDIIKTSENHREYVDRLKERIRNGNFTPSIERKPVLQFDKLGNLINEFPSINSVGKTMRANVSMCCNEKRKSAGGFIWKFKYN